MNLNYTINNQFMMFENIMTDPAHVACVSRTEMESIPDADVNEFSRKFGIESEAFSWIKDYLAGDNSREVKVPLIYPVTVQVEPNSNGTVTRSICAIISKFNNKVPTEMENHLRIIELAKPTNPRVQLSTVGINERYVRFYEGGDNDFTYRFHAKALMDSLVEEELYQEVDLHRYFIDITKEDQAFRYTIGFNKLPSSF